MELKKCPKCNANIDSALSVCLFCGADVSVPSSPYGAQPPVQQPYGTQPQQPVQTPYTAPPQSVPQSPYGEQTPVQNPYGTQPQQPVQTPYTAPPQSVPQSPYGDQTPVQNPYGTQPQQPVQAPYTAYGAPQTPYGTQQGTFTPPETKKKGGKGKIIAIIAVIVVVLVISIAAMASDSGSGQTSPDTPNYNQSGSSNTSDGYSSEFIDIFNDRNIVYVPELFYGLNSAAFAQVDEDNWIEVFEVGYDDNDTINVLVNALYADITGYTDEAVDMLEETMREYYPGAEDLDYVTISVTRLSNYLKFEVTMIELDNPEHVRELERLELLSTTGIADTISFGVSRDGLIEDGFIMR